jgi:hypothetical protein
MSATVNNLFVFKRKKQTVELPCEMPYMKLLSFTGRRRSLGAVP